MSFQQLHREIRAYYLRAVLHRARRLINYPEEVFGLLTGALTQQQGYIPCEPYTDGWNTIDSQFSPRRKGEARLDGLDIIQRAFEQFDAPRVFALVVHRGFISLYDPRDAIDQERALHYPADLASSSRYYLMHEEPSYGHRGTLEEVDLAMFQCWMLDNLNMAPYELAFEEVWLALAETKFTTELILPSKRLQWLEQEAKKDLEKLRAIWKEGRK